MPQRKMRILFVLLETLCVFFASITWAYAGSATYSSPGTYSFTVPTYSTLTIQVWGAGGGGGADGPYGGYDGGPGGASYILGLYAGGGTGGIDAPCYWIYCYTTTGTGGYASGGDVNIQGNPTSPTSQMNSTPGGTAPYGGGGGSGGANWSYWGVSGGDGYAPGGGGGGGWTPYGYAGGGGSGGYSSKTYAPGALTPGSSISLTVGAGGYGSSYNVTGGYGAPGQISISWTTTPPSCSVSADTKPLPYASTTILRWTSANAGTSFYINNVGYVTPNVSGSATIGPLSTTDYTGTAIGAGGTTQCAFSETVSAPASCSLNGTTVPHGSSTTAYQSSQVPNGSSCVSQQRSCNNGALSGSYAYTSCTVAPSCSVTATPSVISPAQASTISWSSLRATSCTGTNFSTSGATSGAVSVTPAARTTYSMSCTGTGGTTQCTSADVALSCPQAWTCSGAGNRTITQTNADCSVSTLATCVSPEFCSPGVSLCINPTPIFNSGVSLSGHLQVRPSLIRSGDRTKLYWNVSNVLSCTISGTNGDTWSALSSTASGTLSSPILNKQVYTLNCAEYPDGSSSYTETQTVNIAPVFREQ